MKALTKVNKIVKVRDVEYPKTKKGYSIIKVKYMGICKTDIDVIENSFTIDNLVIGHEISGYIVKSDKFEKNSYVGINPYTDRGMHGLTENGYFSEYVSVPNNKIYKVKNKLLATYIEPIAASLIDNKITGTVAVYGKGRIPNVLTNILRRSGLSVDLIYDDDKSDKEYDYVINSSYKKLNKIVKRTSKNGIILLRGRSFVNEEFDTLEFIKKELSIESSYYSDFNKAATFIENNEDFLSEYMGEVFEITNWKEAITKAKDSDKKIFLKF